MAAYRSLPLVTSLRQVRNHVLLLERHYSAQQRGFLGKFIDNLKQEYSKDKTMKESIKKFREEAQKLEQSEALQKARQKYQNLEAETSKGSEQLYKHIGSFKEKLIEGIEEVGKTELGKKSRELGGAAAKSVQSAAESLAKQTEHLSQTSTFKAVREGVQAVNKELEEGSLSQGSRIYRPPAKLKKRIDRVAQMSSAAAVENEKTFEPNIDDQRVVLHKDSQWSQGWQNFKDNNPYVNKLFDWKAKYDESDNPLVRASKLVTEKVTDVFGGMFKKTELSEVLTEITKMDPSFDKELFLKECELEIIPNVLEAMVQGDLEVLNDWCTEGAFNVISTPIRQAHTLGYTYDSRILDIDSVDLHMGKMIENSPVLLISFQAQQIMCVRDSKGAIVEGDKEEVLRVNHLWALRRDPTEPNPKLAWKVMDVATFSKKQFV